jgi:glutamyl-tRNA synthetase
MTIRTRYAPSPTGFLHVGGLRTALYNYLYARQNGGRMVLRIEDTDQTRLVEGACENLIEIFRWLGLDFDEGPHRGGAYAPYVQSERLNLYRDHVSKLADAGHVYPCFCSSETLNAMRAEQAKRKLPPMYDRRCRKLLQDVSRARIAAGEPHVWRMRVPDGEVIVIDDIIRGHVDFASATLDDQVLVKSDGFPTYHLANVVDDHYMEISHVIRGEEWLPSTPKHVLLYRFFGWELPKFAHLPLLLNSDRSKMSKRSGDVAVEDYRQKGILPATLINFVALLGWHPQDDREFFSLDELVKEFSLERVNKAGAIFDVTKLRWMNSEYIKAEPDRVLHQKVGEILGSALLKEPIERVQAAALALRPGAETHEELAKRVRDVFAPNPPIEPSMRELLLTESGRTLITAFAERMDVLPDSAWDDFANLETEFKRVAIEAGQACNMKGKALWQTLRAALTGQEHGPELAKLVGIWGRERVLKQLHEAMMISADKEAR